MRGLAAVVAFGAMGVIALAVSWYVLDTAPDNCARMRECPFSYPPDPVAVVGLVVLGIIALAMFMLAANALLRVLLARRRHR